MFFFQVPFQCIAFRNTVLHQAFKKLCSNSFWKCNWRKRLLSLMTTINHISSLYFHLCRIEFLLRKSHTNFYLLLFQFRIGMRTSNKLYYFGTSIRFPCIIMAILNILKTWYDGHADFFITSVYKSFHEYDSIIWISSFHRLNFSYSINHPNTNINRNIKIKQK